MPQNFKNNDFRLGMFGFLFRTTVKWDVWGIDPNPPHKPYLAFNGTMVKVKGIKYPSSQLNVLRSHGFNTVQRYFPGTYFTSEHFLGSLLSLVKLNNMKMLLITSNYYRPIDQFTGTNVYNDANDTTGQENNPYYNWKARPNFDSLFDTVYTDQPAPIGLGYHVADAIWGHQITEEASCFHWFNPGDAPLDWQNVPNLYVEIPPTNAAAALAYFKANLAQRGVINQKMIIMEVNHNKIISTPKDGEGKYNPGDYVILLNPSDSRDVFFEGSYTTFFPQKETINPLIPHWYTRLYSYITTDVYLLESHYLGKFKSIDFAKQFISQVHSVINIENLKGYAHLWNFHTDITPDVTNNTVKVNKPNANWFWFMAYTSFIHGVKGLWMWDLNAAYTENDQVFIPEVQDMVFKVPYVLEADLNKNQDRYLEKFFPDVYILFVKFLAQEIRLLVDWGFLSTDPATIIYTKTDQPDPNCIVPAADAIGGYIQIDLDDAIFNKKTIPGPRYTLEYNDKISENYGLRYTVLINGKSVIMIVSNPINLSVEVEMDFNNMANPIIRNSNGVNFLFEQVFPDLNAVNNSSYKTSRNSNVDLQSGTVPVMVHKSFVNGKLKCAFGSFDVHVLEFVTANPVPSYPNNWKNVWTNFGSGKIGGWKVGDFDEFIPIDVDGNGVEYLLCIQKLSQNSAWASLLKYNSAVDYDWEWVWSNYGNQNIGGWNIDASDKYLVGKFIQGQPQQLLCLQSYGAVSWVTMFSFSGGNWNWGWSNSHQGPPGLGKISNWNMSPDDKYIVGDFNNDGVDELLIIQNKNNNAKAELLSFSNGNWQTLWKNTGSPGYIGLWKIEIADEFISGKLRANPVGNFPGFTLICLRRGGNDAGIFEYAPNKGAWSKTWGNSGTASVSGWGIPLNTDDKIMAANIEGDVRDELMFIQRHPTSGWATIFNFDNNNKLNWGWSNYSNPPYINDWDVTGDIISNTDYLFIQAIDKAISPKFLIARRKYACGNYHVSIYKKY